MRFVRGMFLFSAAFAQGSIVGLVVNPGNNSPARNATVTLTYMPVRTSGTGIIGSAPSTFSADTDGQGRFSFSDLEAGTYRVRVQRRNSAGPMNVGEIQLYLGDGQQLKDIVLSMPTQAIVAGKVLDEFGEPVERAQVSLLRPQSLALRRGRQWVSIGNASTNDLGEYRITVSTPGNYIVCASLTNIFRSGSLNQPLPEKPEMAYVGTCHPSATEVSGAAMLTVGTAEIDGVDIKLQKVPTVRIRGRLISPPLPDNRRASPMLQPRDGMDGAMPGRNMPAMTNPNGTFEFSGVKAGSYILSARLILPRSGGAVGPADQYYAALPVDVTDKSIEGLTLTLAPSKSVHGAIRFEGNPPTNPGRMQVLVTPMGGQGMGIAQAQASGNSFIIPNVPPGPSVVSVNAAGNWYAKSFRYGGKEIPPEGVDLTTGAELEIVLGGDGAQVRGTVANAAGDPLFGGLVTMLATGGPQPSVPTTVTGPGGSYVFPVVHPGEYKLFAWEAVDAAEAQNPDFLRQFADKATIVKLEPGDGANVPLKPISAADTGVGPDTSPPAFVHAKGSLEGQVLNAVNGQPVANATVRLNGSGGTLISNGNIRRGTFSGPPRPRMLTARSDEQGRFVFPSLEPGVYMASTDYSQGLQPRGGNISRESIIVGEGQHVRNAVVKLSPPIAISGKVVDEHGMGLPNTRLTVLQIDYSSGKPSLTATNQGADTDERGEYHISLPAGDYTLAARYLDRTPPDFFPQRPLPAISDFGYPVTYYPGTPDADAAKPLTLDAEGNAIANMTLTTAPMWRIRGQVVNPHGPLPRLNVTVFANDRSARAVLGTWFVALHPDGAFEVSGLPSGSYSVVARSADPGQNRTAVQPVDVRGKSVGGVRLELASGRDVEASVLTDDQSATPSIPVTARLTPLDGYSSIVSAQASPSKLQFLNMMPVPYTIRVQVPPNCNCYVKSIRYAGHEMSESGAILTGGEPFEIVLGIGLASLEGTVVDAQGQPAAGAAVVLVPRNAALAAIKTVAADSHGHFAFPGNPPGEYKLLAWADGAIDPIHVPAPLVENEARAKTLNLDRGGRQTVQVTAIPR